MKANKLIHPSEYTSGSQKNSDMILNETQLNSNRVLGKQFCKIHSLPHTKIPFVFTQM